MAKPKIPNQRKQNLEHKTRIERYVALINQLYARLNNEAAKIAERTGHDDTAPFRWSDYPETKSALQKLQADYVKEMGAIVMSGTSNEWKESNLVQDLVAKKVLKAYTGTDKAGEEYKRYFESNPDALEAFRQRKENGMKLSDRVWNLSEQYKTELEDAISAAIEPGQSAMSLAVDIKQYLNEPDLMFRRFRYKDESGQWKKKWKRKITDEDGKTRFIDCDKGSYCNQWTGRGYYKSSAKNARRLARTEINMAYRTAEQARWEQFDFVVGYEVKTTQNGHHVTDICDDLKGKYPKSFKFTGWHPMCMCYCVPILKTEDEFWSDDDVKSVNEVTDVPKGFKDWVEKNAERINAAEGRGKLPYFIADNAKYTDPSWKPGKAAASANPMPALRPKTPLEIADERHARRTAEEAEKIQKAWSQRQLYGLLDALSDGKLPAQAQVTLNALSEHIFFGEYAEFNQKAAPLLSAVRRHTARTVKSAKLTQAAWDIRRIESLLPSIQNQDLKNYLEAHLPAAKTALKGGMPVLVTPLRAKIATATQESFMHTFASRGSTMGNQSPVFKEAYDRLFDAINSNDGITACRLLPEVRTKAATLTRWNLRKWECIDRTFTFEGIDTDRVIYQGTTLTTSSGTTVKLKTLQQDLLKFKDKNGVTFYYTLGIAEGDVRYSAQKASKMLEGKPLYIRDNLSRGVIFTDRDHPLDKYFQQEYKNFRKGAMYSGDPVTVHRDYTHNDDGFSFSLCHEVGHHIDLKIGWRRNAASQAAWKQAQSDDGNFYRDYGQVSPIEDFADIVSLYTIHGEKWLAARHPHRAAIIKKILAAL